jgi:hypothetical protein
LNPPLDTKEASHRLANAWWERKLAELNRPDPANAALQRHQEADLEEKIRQAQATIAAAMPMLNALRGDPHRVRFTEGEQYEIIRPRTTPETILEADAVLSPPPAQSSLLSYRSSTAASG